MTQGELEKLPQPVQKAFSDLEKRIMTDIVRRVEQNGFATDSADWQVSRLQQLGESEENIRIWMWKALDISEEEVEAIFSDALYEQYTGYERAYKVYGKEQIPYEQNEPLQQLVEATRKQISKEFRNLANSSGFVMKDTTGKIIYSPMMDFYRKTLDNAVMDIHSGAFSYQTVLKRTISQLTSSGVRYVDYSSGRHLHVDVAARMAVMTGFRQVQGQINQQLSKDLGTDTYQVTWHAGARPTHQPWQGKVWTYQQLEEVCGLGSVTGLHGANCYHDYNAFIPGFSIRAYTDEWLEEQNQKENTPKEYLGKNYTTYEALQKQRSMERSMRKTRQDISLLKEGKSAEEDVTLAKAKYQGQMQQYQTFSKKMDLPVQMDRIYQDGLGKVG